jgi:hypothetical protein
VGFDLYTAGYPDQSRQRPLMNWWVFNNPGQVPHL